MGVRDGGGGLVGRFVPYRREWEVIRCQIWPRVTYAMNMMHANTVLKIMDSLPLSKLYGKPNAIIYQTERVLTGK